MIQTAPNKGKRLLITVDGPCASGKTTFAEKLSAILRAEVIHTDEFVVPHALKTPERLSRPGGNCDAERLVSEVLKPYKNGETVRFRRYDCRADRMMPEETLPADTRILILEGSYSNLEAIRAYADLCLFVNTPEEIRMRRLQKRETEASLERFRAMWIPLENAYFEAYGLPDENCVIINGASARE